MQMRTRLGRFFDTAILAAMAFIALALFLALNLGNVLLGAGLALPTTALLFYAFSLWRRRGDEARLQRENGKWQLHMLMLKPAPDALNTAAAQVAKAHGIDALRPQGDYMMGMMDGKETAIALLQRPLQGKVDSETILGFYHASSAERILLLSTAPFTPDAAIFARQLRGPQIAIMGPDALEPLLRSLPRDEEAHVQDKKKRRLATLSELRDRAAEPERIRRYLLYGALMLCAYIALGIWPFLIPGLACVFLAVIAGRRRAKKRGLFEKDAS